MESPHTAGIVAPRDLKTALMTEMRQAGRPVRLPDVEAAYSRLLRDREVRENLAALRQTGATVRYFSVDVRDEAAFGQLIDEIYRQYGRLDGVIHGAGVIADSLVEDKTPDAFDRVFDTKALSAFVLSRKLQTDSLKVMVLFSSVAGRFGNRGQADYAAANEVLNKLAVYLDDRWPARVVAVNWGPWAKTGMVSAEIRRQFEARGVPLIAPACGRRALDRELRYGRKGEAEVVLGGGPWQVVAARESRHARGSWPLLEAVPLAEGVEGVEATYRLDPAEDLYLQDHRLDEHPVLPAAVAMELMAEVVQKGWPQWTVVAVRELRVLKGIVVENGPQAIHLVARGSPPCDMPKAPCEVDVEIRTLDQPTRICYRATVQLGSALPEPACFAVPIRAGVHTFPLAAEEVYRRWLFHGPRFQCISRIASIDDQGIVATVIPSTPAGCLARRVDGPWLIDPIVVDSAPQLAIIWARAHADMTALPAGFRSYRRWGALSGQTLDCHFRVLPSSGGHALHADVFFVDASGRVVGSLEGLEATCSAALNRLAGAHDGREE
jgi:NAD(P)-dependent dehydrogenase (short-subunit alcohol dehydrogenase family)